MPPYLWDFVMTALTKEHTCSPRYETVIPPPFVSDEENSVLEYCWFFS